MRFARATAAVRVPATSGNLGPGFDSMGMAHNLWDEVHVRLTTGATRVVIQGQGRASLPTDESHLIVRAMRRGFQAAGLPEAGIELTCRNGIYQGRGLGSSAAAVVAGLLLVRGLVDHPEEFDDAAVLSLATGFEGHPDNVAPAPLAPAIRTTLTKPQPAARPQRSNSGSTRVVNAPTKVAAPSRIWVEGVHDAAIVEKIWGHDLRVEGVVVEYLEGLDNLPHRLAEFRPAQGRRVGVLADHLVAGSKETRLTDQVGEHVLVTGHPYIDIWAAVKPERLGIRAWPEIPRGEDWKTGVCARLGWANPQEGWNRVYRAVSTYKDLDSTLIGAVERLVDFVTTPELTKADLR